MRKKVNAWKNKAGAMLAKANLMAVGISMAVYNTAYADDLADVLKQNLTSISDQAISALAAIIGIAALISGAMSVKDMAEGSKSSNPEQQEKGQKTLTAAIGMAVAAAVLLGIRSVVATFITTAMGG